ncbi:hypothetical protein [Microtetraspora fusca]|uniref:hypothetical protein n=1 Tax=Microtetraspora fusca TaxID=1997 RepID=UPI0012F7ED32|nr:hypothetical protein [Microtetraspora fusca]
MRIRATDARSLRASSLHFSNNFDNSNQQGEAAFTEAAQARSSAPCRCRVVWTDERVTEWNADFRRRLAAERERRDNRSFNTVGV